MTQPTSQPKIVRLGAADFAELNRHLSGAFGRKDFAGHLPSLYAADDASMGRILAIRESNRIIAALSLFDMPWRLGDSSLRLAGIGGVSVDPTCGGRGLMRLLMDAAVVEIERGGFHAAWLDGARGRYGHWGFEKGGAEAVLRVTANSLSHHGSVAASGGQDAGLTPPTAGDAEALLALARSHPLRIDREVATLPTILRNRRHETVVLRDAAGHPLAYACLDRASSTVHEFGAADGEALNRLVATVRGELGGWASFRLPLLHTPVFRQLRTLAEDAAVEEVGNWWIRDWPAVLTAAMRLKHQEEGLPEGSVVLRIRGAGVTVRMSVDASGARCASCGDRPAAAWTPAEAVRRLTGPLPEPLPGATAPLRSWCPLPIGLPMQDRV